jgi:hypothetical protein
MPLESFEVPARQKLRRPSGRCVVFVADGAMGRGWAGTVRPMHAYRGNDR